MSIKQSVTIEEAIAYLNDLVSRDQKAITQLIEHRVEISDKGPNGLTSETCSAQVNSEFKIGLLGVLNGLFGSDDSTGYGALAIEVEKDQIQFINLLTE